MEQRLDLVTVGVPDVDAVREFYLEGLGWAAAYDAPGEIVFLQVGRGLLLGLWHAEALDEDAGGGEGTGDGGGQDRGHGSGISAGSSGAGGGFSFAHNVSSSAEVDAVLDTARRASATILKPGQPAAFGGYHGYFADPAGIRWEVAHNPGWSVDGDGRVTLDAIE